MRPAVMPRLSELPEEEEQRNGILDQSLHTPGPEERKGQTKKERRVETGAAWAAAMIGSALSTHQNVTLGAASTFDENAIVGPVQQERAKPAPTEKAPEEAEPGKLVPWVKL